MKSTKTFLFLAVLLIAGGISAYGQSWLERVSNSAKRANEAVQGVNDVIRNVDETVEAAGTVKEGVQNIGRDTADVLGVDTTQQSSSSGAAFVLPNGEAWVKSNRNLRSGYIFQSDGTYCTINNYDGEVIGQWTIVTRGTWTTRGNNITLVSSDSGAERSHTYTVSGSTLTLVFFGEAETYTRTSGVNPDGNVYR
jgi:hypothetical protein